MLPSAGHFEKINCPFFRGGFCERPFCQYKHAKDERVFVTLHRSPFTKAAGTGRNHLTSKITHQNIDGSFEKDPCLLELERINKEIETVKCEVEMEQRRLSHYKSLQGDCDGGNKVLIPYNESVGKDRNSSNHSTARSQKSTVVSARISKYVVDKSRLRTDLEYDPLSNYAADVRSSCSAEHKLQLCDAIEEKQGLKRTREKGNKDPHEPLTLELEDSDDEGILIIDVPPLEIKMKNCRPPKLRKAFPKVPEETMPLVPISDVSGPIQLCKPEVDLISVQSDLNSTPPSPGIALNEGSECDQNQSNAFEDLTKCLETLRSESEKIIQLPKVEPVPMNKGNIPSECPVINPVSWSLKGLQGEQNSSSIGLESQLTKSDLAHSCDEKGNSPLPSRQVSSLNLTGSDPGTLPLALKSSSNVPGNGQQGTSVVEAYWLPVQHIPLLCLQKPTMQIPGPDFTQVHAVHLLQKPSTSGVPHLVTNEVELLPVSNGRKMHKISEPVAKTDLSSGEEIDYSDMDLSDSDPMEECYRIFMEANQAGQDHPGSSPVEVSDPERPEVEQKTLLLSGPKKRVAHVSKHNGTKKSRQHVIVPMRGSASHFSNPSRIQQLQQKATVLTTAIKGGQAFVAATTGHKKPVTLAPAPQPSPVQTTCVNIIPVGATIQLGSSVHFIIPEGNIALPLTPVPTPVVPPQQTTLTAAKPTLIKRKLKPRPESSPVQSSTKVPHDIRQRYVNLFVEEFLKTSFTVQDAFEKALAEEKLVYDRSINKLKYLSVAVNALKKLKNQNAPPVKASTESNVQGSRGKIVLTPIALQANDPGVALLYEQLKEHILSGAGLKECGYPLQHPEKPGCAVLYVEVKKGATDFDFDGSTKSDIEAAVKRICCRCGATFSVSQSGRHVRKEECNYHYGKVVENKVPGGMETRYSCCEGAIGTPGCQVFKLHVHDTVSLDGFVSSLPKPPPEDGCPGVFALDCEMCYTTQGLELARVTVVNTSLQIIYDTFVKPDNEVIDYNTRFSGVSEEDLKASSSSIHDVQEVLQSFVSTDTILIGYGLEKDLCALKLLHSTVVDISAVFPHRLGLPHKRGLRSLTADYLRRIIQESVKGHDSGEDATACMELMLWKVKEDGKVKRW